MYHNNDFIYEAISQLEELINIPIDIDSSRKKYDAIVSIRDQQFIVDAKSAIRTSNQGLVLSKLEELKQKSNHPIILIAKYISKNAATELKNREINYIDIAGNAYIKNNKLAILVEGQKRKSKQQTNQSRAFQEAGIKIIFYLLRNPESLQHSYREIAENANVSIGSVSNVMAELEDLNFLMKTKDKRVLKNKSELIERWMVAFNTVLRPRILRKKMKFIDPNNTNEWKNLNLNKYKGDVLWGGEPGGAILTNYLKPEKFTIFTNYDLPTIAKNLKLVPDQNGYIEILQIFWKRDNENTNVAPALLIYTDLINSGLSRNMETAKIILDNELRYIE